MTLTEAGTFRVMRQYRPSCDKRRDPMTRGLCGVVWCMKPARWVWFDRAGRQRHRCEEHA